MKIRTGFVSNSSSSSFVCSICGQVESGFDAGLNDFDMVRCENDHEFHIECSTDSELQKILDNAYERAEDGCLKDENGVYYEDYRYALPAKYCPMCRLDILEDRELAKYLIKKSKKTVKEHLDDIKTEFGSYDKFKEWLK